jgi:hypothetical protein
VQRGEPRTLLGHHGATLVGDSLVSWIHLLGWHAGFVRIAQLTVGELLELRARPAGLLLRELDLHGERSLQTGQRD